MKYIVSVPVCDLRKTPLAYVKNVKQDFNQESQLLYGEYLKVLKIEDSWAFVEAIEQKKYVDDKWLSYPGWVELKNIIEVESYPEQNLIIQKPFYQTQFFSFGTRLDGVKKTESHWQVRLHTGESLVIENSYLKEIADVDHHNIRDEILSLSASFIDTPYHWGGRSSYCENSQQATSLDCSALTNLLYRVQGINIPRDAHDQYLICKEVEYNNLKKADFIFLKDNNKSRMNHVMLYIDGDLLLESTIDPGVVRIVTSEEKLGRKLSSIQSGDIVEGVIVKFGTILFDC